MSQASHAREKPEVLTIYANHPVGNFGKNMKFYDLATCLNRRWTTCKMYQHQLEIPKGAVIVHHFEREPINIEMFQMEQCVPFNFPTGISKFSVRPRSPITYILNRVSYVCISSEITIRKRNLLGYLIQQGLLLGSLVGRCSLCFLV